MGCTEKVGNEVQGLKLITAHGIKCTVHLWIPIFRPSQPHRTPGSRFDRGASGSQPLISLCWSLGTSYVPEAEYGGEGVHSRREKKADRSHKRYIFVQVHSPHRCHCVPDDLPSVEIETISLRCLISSLEFSASASACAVLTACLMLRPFIPGPARPRISNPD